MEQQNSATRAIASNVQEAHTGTQDVSATILTVNQAAEETGASANSVLSFSKQLANDSSALSEQVNQFLSSVRSR